MKNLFKVSLGLLLIFMLTACAEGGVEKEIEYDKELTFTTSQFMFQYFSEDAFEGEFLFGGYEEEDTISISKRRYTDIPAENYFYQVKEGSEIPFVTAEGKTFLKMKVIKLYPQEHKITVSFSKE